MCFNDSMCSCLQLLKRSEATNQHGSVSYDYSYKLWAAERDVSGRYRWTATTWSHCNATCGTGMLPLGRSHVCDKIQWNNRPTSRLKYLQNLLHQHIYANVLVVVTREIKHKTGSNHSLFACFSLHVTTVSVYFSVICCKSWEMKYTLQTGAYLRRPCAYRPTPSCT